MSNEHASRSEQVGLREGGAPTEIAAQESAMAPEIHLRKTIDELVRDMSREASADPKSFPVAKLELLERLQRVSGALGGRDVRARYQTLIMSVAGFVILAGIAYSLGPLDQTKADISGAATEIAFTVDRATPLFDDTPVESLTCEGIEEVDFGGSLLGRVSDIPRSMTFSLLTGKPEETATERRRRTRRDAALTLQGLRASTDSIVRITKDLSDKDVRVSVVGADGTTVTAVVTFEGRVNVSGTDHSTRSTGPEVLIFQGKSLAFTFVPRGKFSLRRSLAIHALSFEDPQARYGGGFGQPLSTLVKGSMVLTDLGGSQKALRAGQPLFLAEASGLIRSLTVAGAEITFDFSGTVKDIRDGFSESAPSSMPSRLEWIRGNPRVSMLWATVVWLVGALAAGIKHWRQLWR
jgi:hypothetical protein